MFTADDSGTVVLWELIDDKYRKQSLFSAFETPVYTICFDDHSKMLFCVI